MTTSKTAKEEKKKKEKNNVNGAEFVILFPNLSCSVCLAMRLQNTTQCSVTKQNKI